MKGIHEIRPAAVTETRDWWRSSGKGLVGAVVSHTGARGTSAACGLPGGKSTCRARHSERTEDLI